MDEYDRWESPPITFGKDADATLHDQGSRILQKLSAFPFPIPSWPHGELGHIKIIHKDTDHLTTKPNMLHVVRDLFQAGDDGKHTSTINFIFDGPANHLPVETVFKSVFMFGDRPDVDDKEATLIGALTVPASSGGLGSVDFLPQQIKNCTEVAYERKKLNNTLGPSWGSCLVPIGAITGPHMDYCGCSQLIQHIQGRKLWLCWPPTPRNLDIYLRKYYWGALSLPTEDAIDQLEGLELLLLDRHQTCFTLPVGTIHAVITFSRSSHTGLKLWRTEDFEIAEKMNKIQSEIMDRGEKLDEGTFKHYQKYFRDLKGELKKWEELRRKNLHDKEKISRWILEMEEVLKRHL